MLFCLQQLQEVLLQVRVRVEKEMVQEGQVIEALSEEPTIEYLLNLLDRLVRVRVHKGGEAISSLSTKCFLYHELHFHSCFCVSSHHYHESLA